MNDPTKICRVCRSPLKHVPTPTWPNRWLCQKCSRIYLPEDDEKTAIGRAPEIR